MESAHDKARKPNVIANAKQIVPSEQRARSHSTIEEGSVFAIAHKKRGQIYCVKYVSLRNNHFKETWTCPK